jgi:hypothetical protein
MIQAGVKKWWKCLTYLLNALLQNQRSREIQYPGVAKSSRCLKIRYLTKQNAQPLQNVTGHIFYYEIKCIEFIVISKETIDNFSMILPLDIQIPLK